MARSVKLPEELNGWKIISLISEKKGNNIYRISKKTPDGEKFANLYHIFAYGKDYTHNKAKFYVDEAAFLNSIAKNQEYFTYLGAFVTDNKAKSKVDLYIATEELTSLTKTISAKEMSESDIAKFGLRMADILAFLELKSVFHGDIRPENIFVTDNGTYKLGGFSDFEKKISDLSFSAPEVAKDETPDFTTDIYSLGLVMYYLANNKKLPFENESVNKDEAIEKRFSGKSVSAPANGNEKLKSVIVIACQADNKNRWKNANNLRNALQVILEEMSGVNEETVKDEPVVSVVSTQPESFEENVFEEVVYEDNSDNKQDNVQQSVFAEEINNESSVDNVTEDNFDDNNSFAEIYANNSTKSEVKNIEEVTPDESIDIDVFDQYEIKDVKNNVVVNANEKSEPAKDYGSFFDEIDKDEKTENISSQNYEDIAADLNAKADKKIQESSVETIDVPKDNIYHIDEEDTHSNNKLSKVVIAISVVIVLAALFFVGFIVYNKTMTPDIKSTKPATKDEVTQVTTQISTTEPVTTQQPTTKPETVTVPEVVGFGYSYAKEVLEDNGFVVEEGNFNYSSIYDEGYVMEQSLQPYTSHEKGSTIVLDISLGPEEITTESEAENNYFMSENSNNTYLSRSELDSLSEYELELTLNEIYARRGRIFIDEGLSEYFNSQKWYTPIYSPNEFNSSVTLNEYEEANIKLIVEIQKEKGYR